MDLELITYSMVHSPSWEANWFAASQEIPRISRNPKVHYRTHKRPPPVPILGQPNPVHIPTSHLLEIHPNIIHPSTPRSPQWSLSLRFPQQDPIHPPLLTHTRTHIQALCFTLPKSRNHNFPRNISGIAKRAVNFNESEILVYSYLTNTFSTLFKYISLSLEFTAVLAMPLVFRGKLWFRDFGRVKNNAWILRWVVIFSSENRK